MKFLILFFFVSLNAFSQNCPPGMMNVWTQSQGYHCLPRINPSASVIQGCFGPVTPGPLTQNPFANFPTILYQPTSQPWWVSQGNLYYPNVNYPGAWSYPGIQQNYYPGQGQIFAAKPNVYINSIHEEKKFKFSFIPSTKPQFLATTPILDQKLSWEGKIIGKDKFEMDDIYYDYLFYDLRLPKEKMQFENGFCSTREESIQWMLKDLREMRFSSIALQDFEEHWRAKIPDYPYYCIYPQYNAQIDPVIPVEIELEQSTFIRSLFVLVPHKSEPDIDEPQEIPFPSKDPAEYRPGSKILRENEFREWGVAFLGY